ncbi:MAG: hypothetical protein ABIO85_09575 [Sphingomicrobium sp.]
MKNTIPGQTPSSPGQCPIPQTPSREPDWVPFGSTAAAEHARLDLERGAEGSPLQTADFERARAALIARRRAAAPGTIPELPDDPRFLVAPHPALDAAFGAANGTRAPLDRNEQIAFHIAQLEALTDHDAPGWTAFARRLFLTTLAETGRVSTACQHTGLARAGAYALRSRDRLFAAGWDAAASIARNELADRLHEQALDGITDTLTRDDGRQLTRHRHDTRLSIAVLHRLDKRCDRAELLGAPHHGLEANWDAFTAAIGAGDEAAAHALAFPPAPPPADTATAQSGLTQDAPHRPRCPNAEDLRTLPTSELLRRMKAVRSGSINFLPANHVPDDEELMAELAERVWTDDEGDFTNFAPPPGFGGTEWGEFGEEDYYRTLTPTEAAGYARRLAAWEAEGDAEAAEELAEEQDKRRLFLMIDEDDGVASAAVSPPVPPSPPAPLPPASVSKRKRRRTR